MADVTAENRRYRNQAPREQPVSKTNLSVEKRAGAHIEVE
jgi:hypothetical protein